MLKNSLSTTLFLVTIAEAVIASLNADEREPTDILADGFASWPQNRGIHGPMNHRGTQWVKHIFEVADGYDWRSRERDVLRLLYQNIIDAQHRKAFGEYYTPDWLAQVVIDEVIDDEWLENAIRASLSGQRDSAPSGIGVLDPACGSGTFLFHAARKILQSPQLQRQRLPEAEAGGLVARLINGIDIHPVAVAIARATLLRALPPGSVTSPDDLRVWQGDSLMLKRGLGSLFNPDSGVIEVSTPENRQISIPLAFAESPHFRIDLERIVAAAHNSEPMPLGIGTELDTEVQAGISKLHKTLTEVCANEGNSVWTWYLANYASPFILSSKGVNRIVANPPWVRMNEIQVLERKRSLESRIQELGVSAGGKNATGFDIAGLFVVQCQSHYLKGESWVAGWVLNWSSMSAGNWVRVREKHREFNSMFLDFSKVKDPPFGGAKSCAWIERGKVDRASVMRTYSNLPGRPRLVPTDDRNEFAVKTSWVLRQKHFVDAPSPYMDERTSFFRNGATVFPHALIKIDRIERGEVAMERSRHAPWSNIGTIRGNIPSHYVRDTIFSKDLLVFGVLSPSRTIVPLMKDGNLDFALNDDGSFNFDNCNDPFWNRLNELYVQHRGKGTATPRTLWERINHQNGLLKQLGENTSGSYHVVYNKSGQTLRGHRINGDELIENALYYGTARFEEAGYLVCMINAPCLQLAYQESRESDRHFDLHPVRKVPIPKFHRDNSDHLELVELCELAEVAASEVISGLPDNTGQIKASNLIRKHLMNEGLSDAIDDVVRRVLPSHSVHEYTDDMPHPWR